MTTKKITIDANVFISFFARKEIHHKISAKLMQFVINADYKIVIPYFLVFEIYQSLRKKNFFEDTRDYQLFKSFFNSNKYKYINIDSKLFHFFRKFNFFHKLKTSDAIIATTALASNSILVSWDKQLVQNSHNGYTPSEFLRTISSKDSD